jgi:hypothetical protein
MQTIAEYINECKITITAPISDKKSTHQIEQFLDNKNVEYTKIINQADYMYSVDVNDSGEQHIRNFENSKQIRSNITINY